MRMIHSMRNVRKVSVLLVFMMLFQMLSVFTVSAGTVSSVKLYYKNDVFRNKNVHFNNGDSWSASPGVAMDLNVVSGYGYAELEIAPGKTTIEATFNDGTSWAGNMNQPNIRLTEGTYTNAYGVLTPGIPTAPTEVTKLASDHHVTFRLPAEEIYVTMKGSYVQNWDKVVRLTDPDANGEFTALLPTLASEANYNYVPYVNGKELTPGNSLSVSSDDMGSATFKTNVAFYVRSSAFTEDQKFVWNEAIDSYELNTTQPLSEGIFSYSYVAKMPDNREVVFSDPTNGLGQGDTSVIDVPELNPVTKVTGDGKIRFALPKKEFGIKVKGSFNGWQLVEMTDLDADGTYQAIITPETVSASYEYGFEIAGQWLAGPEGNLVVTPVDGKVTIKYKPSFFVSGTFGNGDYKMEYNPSIGAYTYTTPALGENKYEYSYMATAVGTNDVTIKDFGFVDPTNTNVVNGLNSITVGTPTIIATTISADKKIKFAMLKSDLKVKAKGEFNGWNLISLTDDDQDGVFSTTFKPSAALGSGKTTYEYGFDINGKFLAGPSGNLQVAPDSEGNVTLTFAPTIKVYGSFATGDQVMAYDAVNKAYFFTTDILADDQYTYLYKITTAETNDYFLFDPTNPNKDTNWSMLTVGTPKVIQSEVTQDKKIYFAMPKATLNVKVKGSFNGWDPAILMTDDNNDGIYQATITGKTSGDAFQYGYEVNGVWSAGSTGNLSIITPENGTLVFTYQPTVYVFGTFGTGNQVMEYNPQTKSYEFLTGVLPDAHYSYGYLLKATGVNQVQLSDVSIKDPTNSLTTGSFSKLTVGTPVEEVVPVADVYPNQPGAQVSWSLPGLMGNTDWNVTNNPLSHLVGGDFFAISKVFNPGTYTFKIVLNGNWSNEIGPQAGGNFSFTVIKPTKVNIYVKGTTLANANYYINLPNITDIPQYIPGIDDGTKWPRLVGTIQSVFPNEEAWKPNLAQQLLIDYNFDGTVYKLQRRIPPGYYEAKVLFGNDWGMPEYGDGSPQGTNNNTKLDVLDPSNVTFSIDMSATKPVLTHNYVPVDFSYDGLIDKTQLSFHSRENMYKEPFGAITNGTQPVTLRIGAAKDDVQTARVQLITPTKQVLAFTMHKLTSVDWSATSKMDYFEVTIPKETFNQIGIWGYKFILIDGATKVEYGEDGSRGGIGMAVDAAIPFDLTVYDQHFKTPDWFKNAVIYQIMPDRFFDGDRTNNRAGYASGFRGVRDELESPAIRPEKLSYQYFDKDLNNPVPNDPVAADQLGTWNTPPERPDRANAGDDLWANEMYGGDLQGIEAKLDYLKSLGVNTLYLNPINWASSNHKYDAIDYNTLDPQFGVAIYKDNDPAKGLDIEATRVASNAYYANFTKTAKQKGFRIINDGVFNHTSDDSIYFDRYEKYPEIGAYEYWAKVFDAMKATGKSQAESETSVRSQLNAQIKQRTGIDATEADYKYISWFPIENKYKLYHFKFKQSYAFHGWYDLDILPEIATVEGTSTGDLEGAHEYNVKTFRDTVIGHPLTGTTLEKSAIMKNTTSQLWPYMGSSGWRLDAAPDVSAATWGKFREAVKSIEGATDVNGQPMEEPIIMGEDWEVATRYLLGDQFDTVMNYRFWKAMIYFLQPTISTDKAFEFEQELESIREDYPQEAWKAMMNLVSSHDITRSITLIENPQYMDEKMAFAQPALDDSIKKQALSAIFQMGYPGAPSIYYGDEVGLEGTKDPDSRRTFPWERVIADAQNQTFRAVDKYDELFKTYQKAANLRNQEEAFKNGELHHVYAKGNVIAMIRKSESNASKVGLVVLNRGDTNALNVNIPVYPYLPNGTVLVDQLSGTVTATVSEGKLTFASLPRLTGYMMLSEQTIAPLHQVSNLQATIGNQMVNLQWDAVEDASSYDVFRSLMKGTQGEWIGNVVDVTTFDDTEVVNGTKYFYTVRALKNGVLIGGTRSEIEALPHIPITTAAITGLTDANEVVLAVSKKTDKINVTLTVANLTDVEALAGSDAQGLMARLNYVAGTPPQLDQSQYVKLRYQKDTTDGGKVYAATFEPTVPGIYSYRAEFSTDQGQTIVASDWKTVTVTADASDVTPPSKPVLQQAPVDSNQVKLMWSITDDTVAGFEVMRKASGETTFTKLVTLNNTERAFVDNLVTNDVNYSYQIVAFDAAYNRNFSDNMLVTPSLVIVDVTLRLHLPSYTPEADEIKIMGSFDGWKEFKTMTIPSAATSKDVVEFKFKMQAGKMVEYKYNRNGDWYKEAFISLNRTANDSTSEGNWGYKSPNTKLTIENQGNNQMIVEDYVLRWKDMPIRIEQPLKVNSIRNLNALTVDTDQHWFTFKANIPYGAVPILKVNYKVVERYLLDPQGNVRYDRIPLENEINNVSFSIEPSPTTIGQFNGRMPSYADLTDNFPITYKISLKVNRIIPEYTSCVVNPSKLQDAQALNNQLMLNYSDADKTKLLTYFTQAELNDLTANLMCGFENDLAENKLQVHNFDSLLMLHLDQYQNNLLFSNKLDAFVTDLESFLEPLEVKELKKRIWPSRLLPIRNTLFAKYASNLLNVSDNSVNATYAKLTPSQLKPFTDKSITADELKAIIGRWLQAYKDAAVTLADVQYLKDTNPSYYQLLIVDSVFREDVNVLRKLMNKSLYTDKSAKLTDTEERKLRGTGLLPTLFEPILAAVTETASTPPGTSITGYVNLYLGDGSFYSQIVQGALNADVIEATLDELNVQVFNAQNQVVGSCVGVNCWEVMSNGKRHMIDPMGKVVAKLSLSDVATSGTSVVIGGGGYKQRVIADITLTAQQKIIASASQPIELLPGDIGSMENNQVVIQSDQAIDDSDFTAWLSIYKMETPSANDKRLADFTKDGNVDNLDFTLWLASSKKN